jgi:5,10-methylene-tetrahydrofolate dehydrogenase/methenyl tetrahydrofolate cyclohydrolase
VARYNADPAVHGVLVQLPLPAHVNEERVLSAISLEKDVDGFHPINIGRLAMRGRDPLFVPCTPKGAIQLLERSGVAIAGKRAVVIGRSNIVGMPAAMLLQRRDATVTVVHSRTPAPERIIAEADIVIAAVGVPEFVKGAWLKPGCAVIDVGINPVPDASKKTGCASHPPAYCKTHSHMLTWRELRTRCRACIRYRLVGDVAYAEALPIAGAITPVPGGVGPMTIAMLLQNTLEGAQRTMGLPM